MIMDSLLSILFFLLTLSSLNPSFASQPSYQDHCGSIVPESTPNENTHNSSPFDDHQRGYFTGDDSIINGGTSLNQYFDLQSMYIRATKFSDLFNVEATVSLTSSISYYYPVGNFDSLRYERQRRYRRSHVYFKLEGFWSESSGKACMVGKGNGYSKTGKYLNLDAVFKLDMVFNASNITSLVSGSLESLSSPKDDSYFEPISVVMFSKGNYKYTLNSTEATNEFSFGSDAMKGGLSLSSLSFCSRPLSRAIRRLPFEFSPDSILQRTALLLVRILVHCHF